MNYFQFYDLPVSFFIDESVLKKKFYAFSKEYHPDFYVNESQEKQDEILELSTLNNNAYKVLSNPDKRLEYILEINGLIQDGEKYQLPQAFLMEMMDINEELMDLQMDGDEESLKRVQGQVKAFETDLSEELTYLITDYEGLNTADQKKKLLIIKDNYYRRKYLLRIKDSLLMFAAR
ncbi:Fe-S protein assembly co-chaperone HscB [Solitalea koreensis]|uniref:Molecular chaperone HscB n=1 Tax=Solitalea koreensis TaxID=543615 RepID=A0A521BJH5_9SPHI|nr:Fe-S protein assembly co-chaperone HscB [Solitalea koreensis]SMO47243.1 molecular chaperone HscB [Solitalea koreensis]